MNSKTILRIGLGLVLIAGIALAIGYRQQLNAAALENWVRGAGAAGPIIFMIIYAVAAVFFLPGSVLTLVGGALFGPVWGTFYNLTGATLGATLAFLVARYLVSDWVEQKAGGKFKKIKQGVEEEGWRFVALVRLVPLFPFNLLNYALGLTRIKLLHYIIASYIFMLPASIAYTYLGYAGREAVAGGEGLIQKGLLALALLALVAFLPRLITKMRQRPMFEIDEFKKVLDEEKDTLVLDVRSAADYVGEQGHIADSCNVPLEELSQRMDELGDYLEKTIAIVCRTDKRSVKAAKLLADKGFSKVHVVHGGMLAWNNEGWPVER